MRQQCAPTPAGLRPSGPPRGLRNPGAARRFLQRTALPALLALSASAAQALATFNEVRTAHRPSDAQLLDRQGVLLQTLRTDHQVRRLPWVPLQDLSPALLDAIVLSEDRRFWQHSGIDWSGVARSAWANAWNQRTQGASTLTMQLAGLLDDGLARPAGGRTIGQKLGQALTATQLEARWKKHEILEAYLNSVPLRGELVGVAAMAQALFGKHASGLDAQEAAITAALVRAPNAAATRVAERACGVLSLQHRPCTGLPELAAAVLQRSGKASLGETLAPHLARQVLRPAGPVSARSTLDAGLQRLALRSLRQHLAELSGRNVEDGAVVVLDNASGEVLAWVGSSGPGLSGAHEVDGVLARRQPGSTLKPFVYQLAFEQRLITPASLLDDSPAQLQTGGGLYLPQNYDRRFRGWVSARQALAGSLNIPAVRVGAMLPPDALLQRLNAWGLQLPQTGGYYGQALALGSAEVTLLDLSNAYRALANGGRLSPPRWVLADTNPRAKAAVYSRSGDPTTPDHPALAAARRRCFSQPSGHRHPGGQRGPRGHLRAGQRAGSAGLCGGQNRHQQGHARQLVHRLQQPLHRWRVGGQRQWRAHAPDQRRGRCGAGVAKHHAGAARREAFPSATGIATRRCGSAAALRRWPRTTAYRAVSGGKRTIADRAQRADRAELTRRAIGHTDHTNRHSRYGITHPSDGSIFALDPDIPPAAQRIVFEGEPGQWLLDGRLLPGRSHGRAARANDGADTALQTHRASWAPWPGKHELSLLAPDGRVLQTVHFEVRGAAVKGSPARPALAPNTAQTGKLVSVRR